MKLLQSIRFKIVIACVAFSVIVTLCYGWVTFYGVKYNSDELFNWYIAQESSKLIQAYQQDPNTKLSAMTTATVMVSREKEVVDLLANFVDSQQAKHEFTTASSLADVEISGPYFTTAQGFEIYEYNTDGKTIHVLKSVLTNDSVRDFYYIVDVSKFINYDNTSEQYIADIFMRILFLILLLALIIGFFLAQMVLTPLTRLANSVESIDVEQYPNHRETYFDDEIGLLAGKVDSFVSRTNEFVAREKAFSRDVSHELRTPVASSRAALELAMSTAQAQDESLAKFLKRAYRANKDMTHLIETFLILGREDKEQPGDQKFCLAELVDNAFAKHDYLRKSDLITCINHIPSDIELKVSKQLLSIVIDNLIRNAFQHTHAGSIEVVFERGEIKVRDTGEGIDGVQDASRQVNVLEKSGVGLSIVRRLCDKQGWQVAISSQASEGTCVAIAVHS